MDIFQFKDIFRFLLDYGVLGILAFIFLILIVKKFLGENKITESVKTDVQELTGIVGKLSSLCTDILSKIGTLVMVNTKLNENIQHGSQEIQAILAEQQKAMEEVVDMIAKNAVSPEDVDKVRARLDGISEQIVELAKTVSK